MWDIDYMCWRAASVIVDALFDIVEKVIDIIKVNRDKRKTKQKETNELNQEDN